MRRAAPSVIAREQLQELLVGGVGRESNIVSALVGEVLAMAHVYAVRGTPTLDAARAAADRFINIYGREYPAAIACFTDDLDALLPSTG